jgi:hypothetical protein
MRDHQRTQTAVGRPRSMNRTSTSPCTRRTDGAHPAGYRDKDHRRFAGRCSRPPSARGDAARQTTPTTSRPQNASAATAPAWRSRANCSSAATTRCATSGRRRCNPRDLPPTARHALRHPDAPRPAPGKLLPPPSRWTAIIDRAAATLSPNGITPPIEHHVAGSEPTRIVDRDKAGRPRAPTNTTRHTQPPPTRRRGKRRILSQTPRSTTSTGGPRLEKFNPEGLTRAGLHR